MIGRRGFIAGGIAVGSSLLLRRRALAQTAYPRTIDVLQRSRAGELDAYRLYTACSKQAYRDGYVGIAYLFTALEHFPN